MDQQVYDLMVDFETLGTSRDSIVLSVGLVLFDRNTGIIADSTYLEFDTATQIYQGRTIDPSTVQWWLTKDPEELDRLLRRSADSADPRMELRYFFEDNKGKFKYVWSRHPMDFEILNSFLSKPLEYWRFRDVSSFDILMNQPRKNTHNALEDCENQVHHIAEVLKRWPVRTAEVQ